MSNLNKLGRTLRLAGLKVKKYSPEILVVAGAAGTVVAGVMACKATLKLEETLDECKERKDEIEKSEDIPEDIKKKELAKATIKNATEVAKLYAPAVIVEVASLSVIFASNTIHRKRNASLAAAYATLDSMFKAYRRNVVEAYGEDIDRDMRYGIKHEKVEMIEVDDDGKEKKVKKEIAVIDEDHNQVEVSDYARFYDESCIGYSDCPEYNLTKLKSHQEYLNNLLRIKGYMMLNDVYKELGMKASEAGYSVGWIYDEENDIGDGYIDFGIYRNGNLYKANRRFVNGLEPVILLDFNVDGDLMNNPKLNRLLRKKISKI